jgi:hypothetical protein
MAPFSTSTAPEVLALIRIRLLTLMQIRVRLFILMPIRIQLPKMMRIHADPDPQHW